MSETKGHGEELRIMLRRREQHHLSLMSVIMVSIDLLMSSVQQFMSVDLCIGERKYGPFLPIMISIIIKIIYLP